MKESLGVKGRTLGKSSPASSWRATVLQRQRQIKSCYELSSCNNEISRSASPPKSASLLLWKPWQSESCNDAPARGKRRIKRSAWGKRSFKKQIYCQPCTLILLWKFMKSVWDNCCRKSDGEPSPKIRNLFLSLYFCFALSLLVSFVSALDSTSLRWLAVPRSHLCLALNSCITRKKVS